VARVVAVFDDLLLGSNVLGMLRAAGHDATLSGGADVQPAGVDVLIVDLAAGTFDGVAVVEALRAAGELGGTRTLGVYSHVDADTRNRAQAAGFDLVVPRSRMAREGAQLVERLAT
jgi:DNA-binding NarL/FixJ family response regulator